MRHLSGLSRHSTFRVEWRYNRAVTDEALIFPAVQYAAMLAHVLADRSEERCGLLAGQANRVEAVLPVPNVLRSAVAYQMDGH